MHRRSFLYRRAFTLIELLVVIAIIAILSVVVILTLNPAELLRQSRDANRLSDLDTLNHALSLYSTDQSSAASFSMGSTSTTYLSIADPSATSTAGDQCQGLNLPAFATSTGYTYHCASSSTLRLTNGTGWIPVNFSNISSGSPLGNLPVDSVNSSSSGLFYTYTTDGTKYTLTAILESQKYKLQYANNPPILGYPEVAAAGSSLALSELYNPSGLVGYWPLNEGSGSTALDQSGNGYNWTWNGTQAGTAGYYTTVAKVGSYAGYFNATNDVVSSSIADPLLLASQFTMSMWMMENSNWPSGYAISGVTQGNNTFLNGYYFIFDGAGRLVWHVDNATSSRLIAYTGPITPGTWYFLTGTFDGTNMHFYINGKEVSGSPVAASVNYASIQYIQGQVINSITPGSSYEIDDTHIYSRALSAAEIQAMYNSEK